MRILLVEDQAQIGRAIVQGLTEEAFAVDWVTTVDDGFHLATSVDFDTVILDVLLPDGSGLDLLKVFRKTNSTTPVIILSARDTLTDKTLGFSIGGDDYLTKPFAFEELLARVHSLTRRKYHHHGTCLLLDRLKIDLDGRTATVDQTPLSLTSKEFSLLEFLLLRRGRVLSRETVIEHLYAVNDEQESNVVDVFINRLRKKLSERGINELIETVRGEGYVIR